METLERFQQHRRIIEDLTSRTLAAIPSVYARLLYVATLRDLASGRYRHDGLLAVHPEEAVQQAMEHCHEELFARILEMPLEQQEWDLRACLGSLDGEYWEIVKRWKQLQFYRVLLPGSVPEYLRSLFCSNLSVLLDLLSEERASLQPVA